MPTTSGAPPAAVVEDVAAVAVVAFAVFVVAGLVALAAVVVAASVVEPVVVVCAGAATVLAGAFVGAVVAGAAVDVIGTEVEVAVGVPPQAASKKTRLASRGDTRRTSICGLRSFRSRNARSFKERLAG
ncbi:MAG: hypothetical protein NVS2B7_36830 [Herpetosiphon sp.]